MIRIDVLEEVDGETAERFWCLYEEAFAPLAARAAARQTLHRHEFLDEMRDIRVAKYVAFQRDADGNDVAVGLATLTSSLETVPWISPAYFAARWPEHYEQGRLFYVGFVLVASTARRNGIYGRLLAAMMRRVGEVSGVAGYDACAFNDEVLQLSQATTRLITSRTNAEFVRLDTQTYYAFVF